MTALAVTVAGWAAFALAAGLVVRAWYAALVRGEAVARACHEVRGPLAAARLGLESSLVTSSATHLRAIEVELDRATVALDDLQRVERLGSEARAAEGVDVGRWLSDSVAAWRPVAAARGMDVRLDWPGPEAVIWGRQSRLAQVTGNLIANAIDHGDAFVEVRGRVTRTALVVEVLDGGPGLAAPPPALVAHGRAPLRGRGTKWGRGRARGASHRPSGRGRGLLIARAVAEAHGGSLATAPSKRGARFVLTLPLVGE
jgi:signal transduction histidine kinase